MTQLSVNMNSQAAQGRTPDKQYNVTCNRIKQNIFTTILSAEVSVKCSTTQFTVDVNAQAASYILLVLLFYTELLYMHCYYYSICSVYLS